MNKVFKIIKKNYLKIDIIILITILCFVYLLADYRLNNYEKISTDSTTTAELDEGHVTSKDYSTYKKEQISTFINDNNEIITFYAKTFEINKYDLTNLIKNNNNNDNSFNNLDPFNTGYTSSSIDEAFINYLISLESNYPALFQSFYKPCLKSKEYIIGLIDYYTDIFPNVNHSLAKAIVDVESGYSSSYMLQKNNLFGGMCANGLIQYKNIEYGILKYIIMLSDDYYTNGLNTVEAIGYKFNPIIINGYKEANPTWITNVYNAMSKYQNKTINSLTELNSLT